MLYPDAYRGVKKIYTAEILQIISVVCMIIAGIATTVGMSASEAIASGAATEATGVPTGAAAVANLVGLAGRVLAVVAFVMNIIGIKNASLDEAVFKKAMLWVLISLASSFAEALLQERYSQAASFVEIITHISNLLVTIYVIRGIISLAEKLKNSRVRELGEKTIRRYLTVEIISIILTVISLVLGTSIEEMNYVAATVVSVLGIAALVISIAAYFIYLKTLKQAVKMLEK